MRHHRYTNSTGIAVVRDSESGGHYKSKLERHGFIRWLMKPEVLTARLQEPCIRYRDADKKPRRYTGDLLIEFLPSLRRRPLVVELKYADKLKKEPALVDFYSAMKVETNRGGRDFILETDEDIYAPGFKMMKFVFGYRNNDPHKGDRQLLATVARNPGLTLERLVQAQSADRVEQAELIPAVWRLVALHQLKVDFQQILDRSAKIYPATVTL